MENTLSKSLAESLAAEHGTPLLLVDCAQLRTQVKQLREALPEVDLYYAVKAFPDETVVRELNSLDVNFDVASSGEIEMLRQHHINPRRTINTHPIKKDTDIRDALRFGCTTFVVDNLEELKKFFPYRHRVGLLLRISFRNAKAVVDLSKKFGCCVDEVPAIMAEADRLGLRIKGFSFHVGSQCADSTAHVAAIEQCTTLFSQLHAEFPMLSVLDIGGGFPVAYEGSCDIEIKGFCSPIVSALRKLPEEIHVIAEPGRYLVAPIATAISSVMGKAQRGDKIWYYLDDGVYGNYSGQMFDGVVYPISVFAAGEAAQSVLAGPTCDSIDVVRDKILLPLLQEGDLVLGHMMGAYAKATATQFNSLRQAKTVYLNEKPSDKTVAYIA